jgi:type II secretory pathway pseudopilin PulG
MTVPIASLRNAGFSLIGPAIVISILVIIAMLAVFILPFFGAPNEQAKATALQMDLSALRVAVERYYVQHHNRFPGAFSEVDGRAQTKTASQAASVFVAQLVHYSDAHGKVSRSPSAVFSYGPYIKSGAIPANPFLSGASADDVQVDITAVDSSAASASGRSGWKFYVKSGLMVANDNLTLSDATTRTLDF